MQVPTGSGPVPAYARVGRVVAAAVVAAVVLAGCSGEQPQPGTLPPVRSTSSTSAPASPSATPSPTPTPVEQQIRAAVYAFYAELTRAAQTNDTSRLKGMMTDGCYCYRAVRLIDKAGRLGQTTPEAAWRVRSVEIRAAGTLTPAALVRYTVSRYAAYDRAGKVIGRYPEQKSYVTLSLVRYRDGWIIGNMINMKG